MQNFIKTQIIIAFFLEIFKYFDYYANKLHNISYNVQGGLDNNICGLDVFL